MKGASDRNKGEFFLTFYGSTVALPCGWQQSDVLKFIQDAHGSSEEGYFHEVRNDGICRPYFEKKFVKNKSYEFLPVPPQGE